MRKRADSIEAPRESPTTIDRLYKEIIESGTQIGRGASAKVFETKRTYDSDAPGIVLKVFNREKALIQPNPLNKEAFIQEKTHSIVIQHREDLPDIIVPKVIGFQEAQHDDEEELMIMEKIDGEPLDLHVIKETFKQTDEGREAFEEAKGQPYILANTPDELQQLEAWEIVRRHYGPYKRIIERNQIQTAERDILKQRFRQKDPRLEVLDTMAQEFSAQKKRSITFPDSKEPISKDHAQQLKRFIGLLKKNGIAHRDLGPWNIMLTRDKKIAVLDFGISHIEEDGNEIPTTAYNEDIFILERGGGQFDDIRLVDDRSAPPFLAILAEQEQQSTLDQLQEATQQDQLRIKKRIEQLGGDISQLTSTTAQLLKDPEVNIRQAAYKLRQAASNKSAGKFLSERLTKPQQPSLLPTLLLMAQHNQQDALTLIKAYANLAEIPTRTQQQLKEILQELHENIDNQELV